MKTSNFLWKYFVLSIIYHTFAFVIIVILNCVVIIVSKINESSEIQEKELVELFIHGSQAAFGELYARYKERLRYLCKRLMKNETDLEDTIHDIFVHLWETRNSINPELSFSAYLYTMTRNYILKKFRHFDVHSRFARSILMNGADTTNETENTIADNDYEILLSKAIESLSPRQKETFQLSRVQELSYKEISELLQISVDTVQEHISLALKKIKGFLKQHADIHFQAVIGFFTFFS